MYSCASYEYWTRGLWLLYKTVRVGFIMAVGTHLDPIDGDKDKPTLTVALFILITMPVCFGWLQLQADVLLAPPRLPAIHPPAQACPEWNRRQVVGTLVRLGCHPPVYGAKSPHVVMGSGRFQQVAVAVVAALTIHIHMASGDIMDPCVVPSTQKVAIDDTCTTVSNSGKRCAWIRLLRPDLPITVGEAPLRLPPNTHERTSPFSSAIPATPPPLQSLYCIPASCSAKLTGTCPHPLT